MHEDEIADYLSDEYEFCIGIVGLLKEEYFALTPAETYTKVQAYTHNRDVVASNFRALFHLQFNQWSKERRSAHELWPLSIDNMPNELTEEEMYERNAKIIKAYQEKHGIN